MFFVVSCNGISCKGISCNEAIFQKNWFGAIFLQLIPLQLIPNGKTTNQNNGGGGGILQIKLLLVPLRQISSDHFVDVNKTKSKKVYNCQSLSNNFKKCRI